MFHAVISNRSRASSVLMETSKDALKDILKDKQKEGIGEIVSKFAKYFAKEILPFIWQVAKEALRGGSGN